MRRRPPRSTRTATLFPYTTLFRSVLTRRAYAVELRHDRRKLVIGVVDAERLAAADRTVLRQFRHDAVECLEAAAGDTEWRCRLPSFAVEAEDSFHETRSEERRVGKECVSTCRSRWSAYH